VHEPGRDGVALLAQRVEREERVLGQQLGREGEELPAQRVADRVVPADEREEVGGDAHAHGRARHAERDVVDERRAHAIPERRAEAVGRGDRVARLPEGPVEEPRVRRVRPSPAVALAVCLVGVADTRR